jgi:hypothetical protein
VRYGRVGQRLGGFLSSVRGLTNPESAPLNCEAVYKRDFTDQATLGKIWIAKQMALPVDHQPDTQGWLPCWAKQTMKGAER